MDLGLSDFRSCFMIHKTVWLVSNVFISILTIAGVTLVFERDIGWKSVSSPQLGIENLASVEIFFKI